MREIDEGSESCELPPIPSIASGSPSAAPPSPAVPPTPSTAPLARPSPAAKARQTSNRESGRKAPRINADQNDRQNVSAADVERTRLASMMPGLKSIHAGRRMFTLRGRRKLDRTTAGRSSWRTAMRAGSRNRVTTHHQTVIRTGEAANLDRNVDRPPGPSKSARGWRSFQTFENR
jgi:hypothetical protein